MEYLVNIGKNKEKVIALPSRNDDCCIFFWSLYNVDFMDTRLGTIFIYFWFNILI